MGTGSGPTYRWFELRFLQFRIFIVITYVPRLNLLNNLLSALRCVQPLPQHQDVIEIDLGEAVAHLGVNQSQRREDALAPNRRGRHSKEGLRSHTQARQDAAELPFGAPILKHVVVGCCGGVGVRARTGGESYPPGNLHNKRSSYGG